MKISLNILASLSFSLLALSLTDCSTGPKPRLDLNYSSKIHQIEKFIPHQGPGPMQNYLAQNLNEKAIVATRIELENRLGRKLLHRGEAHLTVVTPVEFDQVLSSKLKMNEIEALAQKMKIQENKVKPVCLGRGSLTIEGQEHNTYYMVIESDATFKLRQAVQALFVQKGGKADQFNPDHFYPHITIGYTKRDLHYEDGVIKDERSCIFSLKEKN